jgi:hypothetical protein
MSGKIETQRLIQVNDHPGLSGGQQVGNKETRHWGVEAPFGYDAVDLNGEQSPISVVLDKIKKHGLKAAGAAIVVNESAQWIYMKGTRDKLGEVEDRVIALEQKPPGSDPRVGQVQDEIGELKIGQIMTTENLNRLNREVNEIKGRLPVNSVKDQGPSITANCQSAENTQKETKSIEDDKSSEAVAVEENKKSQPEKAKKLVKIDFNSKFVSTPGTKKIADFCSNQCGKVSWDDFDTKRDIIRQGLAKVIEKSTSESERIFAGVGLDILNKTYSLNAGNVFLKVLNNADYNSKPVKEVYSSALTDAFKEFKSSYINRMLLDLETDNFFTEEIGPSPKNNENKIKIDFNSKFVSTPGTKKIADFCFNQCDKVSWDDFDTKRNIIRQGLAKVIEKSTSESERIFAGVGLDILNKTYSLNAGNVFLKVLNNADYNSKPVKEVYSLALTDAFEEFKSSYINGIILGEDELLNSIFEKKVAPAQESIKESNKEGWFVRQLKKIHF